MLDCAFHGDAWITAEATDGISDTEWEMVPDTDRINDFPKQKRNVPSRLSQQFEKQIAKIIAI